MCPILDYCLFLFRFVDSVVLRKNHQLVSFIIWCRASCICIMACLFVGVWWLFSIEALQRKVMLCLLCLRQWQDWQKLTSCWDTDYTLRDLPGSLVMFFLWLAENRFEIFDGCISDINQTTRDPFYLNHFNHFNLIACKIYLKKFTYVWHCVQLDVYISRLLL